MESIGQRIRFRPLLPKDRERVQALHEEWFPVKYKDEFYDELVLQRMVHSGEDLYTCAAIYQPQPETTTTTATTVTHDDRDILHDNPTMMHDNGNGGGGVLHDTATTKLQTLDNDNNDNDKRMDLKNSSNSKTNDSKNDDDDNSNSNDSCQSNSEALCRQFNCLRLKDRESNHGPQQQQQQQQQQQKEPLLLLDCPLRKQQQQQQVHPSCTNPSSFRTQHSPSAIATNHHNKNEEITTDSPRQPQQPPKPVNNNNNKGNTTPPNHNGLDAGDCHQQQQQQQQQQHQHQQQQQQQHQKQQDDEMIVACLVGSMVQVDRLSDETVRLLIGGDGQANGPYQRLFYLMTLGTVQEFRHLRLATMLVQRVMDTVQQDPSCGALYLHVITFNDAAIAFYERLGFYRVTEIQDYYRIDGKHYNCYLYAKYMNGNRGQRDLYHLAARYFVSAWQHLSTSTFLTPTDYYHYKE